ncbi:MAG TPA: formate/nitrite transporter family protein [Gaiellaceae bacterium]|nr:formate/nitrite transporter family protein [Gaiellaceae bacterium]
MGAPEPEEIYERTRLEGRRRLERPLLELVSTAMAAGFDILAGVVVLTLLTSQLEHHWGKHAAHVFGSLGFGIGFVFLVVGRGELFTENFLVPLAGLDGKERNAWWKVGELWTVSPLFNILAGGVLGVLLTVHSVLPYGTGGSARQLAETVYANGWLALFVSALFAGALITAMTWFVEGQESQMVRVVVAWIAGAILALGSFDHVIVVTLELIFGIRYGAHVPWSFVVENFFVAAGGNMLGGIGLVTLNRFTQARAGGRGRSQSSSG